MSGAEKINAKVSNIIKLNDLVTRFEFERTDGQLFPTFSGLWKYKGRHVIYLPLSYLADPIVPAFL